MAAYFESPWIVHFKHEIQKNGFLNVKWFPGPIFSLKGLICLLSQMKDDMKMKIFFSESLPENQKGASKPWNHVSSKSPPPMDFDNST